jgi:hypothetical protein
MLNAVKRTLRRILRIFLFGVVLAAALSFLAAIGVSKLYWGYPIRRPPVDRRIKEIEEVISLVPVDSGRKSDGSMGFVINDAYQIAERLSVCRDTRPWISYYCLDERILVILDELGKLPMSLDHTSPPPELATLYHWLDATQLLYNGAPGYRDQARELRGIVLVAQGKNGQRYLLAAVSGGQVSNDHHPYYEFLFRLPEQDPAPILLSSRRFFYDVAGMEGMDGLALWPAFFLVGMVIVTLVVGVLSIIGVITAKRLTDASGP